ncbi:MAG TPA: hypothetical protein VGN81_18145 [Pseudonocardiaceae bacterium]|jgi:hypothetical protein
MDEQDEALEAGYAKLAESRADEHDELREIRDRALRRHQDD